MASLPSSPLTSGAATPADVAKQIKSLLREGHEVRADAARLDELRRLFTGLEAGGELSFGTAPPPSSSSRSPVAARWHAFLVQSHRAMVSQLLDRVRLGRHSSVRCLWGVIAGSPLTSTRRGRDTKDKTVTCKRVNADLLQKWMRAMTLQESTSPSSADGTTSMDKAMRHMVEAEFLRPFRDVQYYSLGAITKLAALAYNDLQEQQQRRTQRRDRNDDDDDNVIPPNEDSSSSKVAERLLELLMMIPVPASEEELEESQFLFPPPADAVLDEGEEEDGSDVEDETDDDDESNDGSDSDEDEDESADHGQRKESNRPTKRQKTDQHKFAFQQMRMFRREYQKAWLAILRLPLSTGSLKKALHVLPTDVLNYVRSPLRFADFFMQAYSDYDSGILGVLALDGLFILITEHGLEYPNFYKQLYRLISSRVLYAKYRTRFFLLLNKCLVRNEMLPAHIVAAFVKRLCRSALSGPPPGALFVLALVSNLLRKHPECNCLIQRKVADSDGEMEDSFIADQDDPVECRALQSSLWELAVLERHYYPAVSAIAKSIGREEEAKAPLYVIEDFASHTFTSLFEQEKKKKTQTALTFKEPVSLFTHDDVFSDCFQIGSP